MSVRPVRWQEGAVGVFADERALVEPTEPTIQLEALAALVTLAFDLALQLAVDPAWQCLSIVCLLVCQKVNQLNNSLISSVQFRAE